MLCYAVLVQQLTDTHHYSPFPTWQPKWFPFNRNQIMTGSCLKTSLHWLPMTIRIKSKFLIIRSRSWAWLCSYISGLLFHFHLVLLCLPCLPHQSFLAFWLFITHATFIPILGPLHFLFPLLECSFLSSSEGLLLIIQGVHPNVTQSERLSLTTLSAPTVTFCLIILFMTSIAFR